MSEREQQKCKWVFKFNARFFAGARHEVKFDVIIRVVAKSSTTVTLKRQLMQQNSFNLLDSAAIKRRSPANQLTG